MSAWKPFGIENFLPHFNLLGQGLETIARLYLPAAALLFPCKALTPKHLSPPLPQHRLCQTGTFPLVFEIERDPFRFAGLARFEGE